jgi:2-keto-4-pentenoate hydratase/2-oxohepta-3-ene-1,7-dioic acid hydratase in catechol pathway
MLAARSDRGYFSNGTPVAADAIDSLVEQGRDALVRAGQEALGGRLIDLDEVEFLPPLARPSKIICVGLNYRSHSAESGFQQPDYPTLFMRSRQSLVAHKAPIIRPLASNMLDYEGELAAVVGKRGRHIARSSALDHVAAYTLFNDASVRDYQHRTPQWTVGKNFDGTGAIGPDIVTADELPPGGAGLAIETVLNGEVVQKSNTSDLVFDVATLIEVISAAMTLAPGDLIVTGTPAGVGHARKPPLYMRAGDKCEVRIERLGILANPIVDEVRV